MTLWNRSLNRFNTALLHQLHEYLVEIRAIFLDLSDIDPSCLQRLEHARDRDAGFVDRQSELLKRQTMDRLDPVQAAEAVDDRPLQPVADRLHNLAAEGLPAQLLRTTQRDKLAAPQDGNLVAVFGLGHILARDDDRSALVTQLSEAVPDF